MGGFRALKKTLEALYTTKVNNRDRTSRGTTLTAHQIQSAVMRERTEEHVRARGVN